MQAQRTRELLDDLVTRLHHLPRRKLTLLVGVGGIAAEGRGRFVNSLSGRDREIITIDMSDFRRPRSESGAEFDVDSDSIDWRRLRGQVLLPLQRNLTAAYQRTTVGQDAPAVWCQVPVGGIVLIHGPHACMRQLAHAYDFKIWVEVASQLSRGPFLGQETEITNADLVVDGSPPAGFDPTREYIRIRF